MHVVTEPDKMLGPRESMLVPHMLVLTSCSDPLPSKNQAQQTQVCSQGVEDLPPCLSTLESSHVSISTGAGPGLAGQGLAWLHWASFLPTCSPQVAA